MTTPTTAPHAPAPATPAAASTSRVARLKRVLLTPYGKRIKVLGREPPHGIALFSVLIAIALMTSVVTDLGYNEMVRYKLAANDRDALKAQALAESGVNISRLLLAVQSAVQPMLTQLAQTGIPLPAQTVWELVPLESDLIKGLTTGELQSALGMDVSAALAKREEERLEKAEDQEPLRYGDDDVELSDRFEPPAGGFGAFDGNFSVKIEDEERKAVSLRGWSTKIGAERFAIAQRLYTVLQPERYDFLFEERDSWDERTDRYELVAHVFDWIDTNEDATDPKAEPGSWGSLGSSPEDAAYNVFDEKIRPKNEVLDSFKELLLVKGFNDAHMKAFGEAITIYGENKTNILSAPPESVESLVRICAGNPADPLLLDEIWMRTTVLTWMECKRMGMLGGGCQASPDGFVLYLQAGLGTNGLGLVVDRERCLANISTESKNFTVKSTATVGDVTRTITTVMRVTGAVGEERYYYSITE